MLRKLRAFHFHVAPTRRLALLAWGCLLLPLRFGAVAAEAAAPDGWSHALEVGANFAFHHSSRVVGATDGSTVQIGLALHGKSTWSGGRRQWTTSLDYEHSQSRTPTIDSFVKAADRFKLQTEFDFRMDEAGRTSLYARGLAATQLFETYEVRADDTTVIRLFLDGGTETFDVAGQERIALSGAFDPLKLAQEIGFAYTPPRTEALAAKIKIGAGLQQVLAGGGFAISDDETTPELEIAELESVSAAGGTLELELEGQLAPNITWTAKGSFFQDLANNSVRELSALNADLNARLAVKLTRWLSLDYTFSAKKIPAVLDDWQIQSGLVLSTGFSVATPEPE